MEEVKTGEVYRDDRYVLGITEGLAYIKIACETYQLTCHPYEPCLYITDGAGRKTAVHNSFDPLAVLYAFRDGKTVTSITGMEYDAGDFCRMVEYAAPMGDVQIDDAEKVFGNREKKKHPKTEEPKDNPVYKNCDLSPKSEWIVEQDPFYDLLASYPDSVIDYCLVRNGHTARGCQAHRMALIRACGTLFFDEEDGETLWRYDARKAEAKPMGVEELFAPVEKNGKLNYRKAFLHPPYETGYRDADFEKINAALFPNGTEELEIFEWTTDWSDYFDDGREWWGTLCLTVYDQTLDRFAVILASATD